MIAPDEFGNRPMHRLLGTMSETTLSMSVEGLKPSAETFNEDCKRIGADMADFAIDETGDEHRDLLIESAAWLSLIDDPEFLRLGLAIWNNWGQFEPTNDLQFRMDMWEMDRLVSDALWTAEDQS